MKKLFNSEYAKLWKEPLLLSLLWLTSHSRVKREINNNSILIVVPCLIGEFAAAIPAIVDFANRNPDKKIDLLVTPQLKPLAEKVSGISRVYATASVYERRGEERVCRGELRESYEKVIALRMSGAAYSALRGPLVSRVETSATAMLRYSLHLLWSVLSGKTPKCWRAVNFEMLGGVDTDPAFEKLFNFTAEDHDRCNLLLPPESGAKRVIVHTTANWASKNWPEDRWYELLEKVQRTDKVEFIFVGSDEDSRLYSHLASRASFPLHSLIHKASLRDLPLVFSKADFFIGIDSGPSNLAHLVKLPSITLVGVSPNMYLSSNKGDITIDKTGNRGIFHLFFAIKDNAMSKIQVDDVYKAFLKLGRYRTDRVYTQGI